MGVDLVCGRRPRPAETGVARSLCDMEAISTGSKINNIIEINTNSRDQTNKLSSSTRPQAILYSP